MSSLADVRRRALATALSVERVVFPRGHAGSIGDPAAFEARLGAVLGQR